MAPARWVFAAIALVAAAGCGGNGGTPPPPECDALYPPTSTGSAAGTFSGAVAGSFPARAAGWTSGGSTGGALVLDAFEPDIDGRPERELFLYHFGSPLRRDTVALTPLTLAQMDALPDLPTISFLTIGDSYDETLEDYGRWFVSASGCLIIDGFTANGSANAKVLAQGTWITHGGESLGAGQVVVTIASPIVSFVSPAGIRRDTIHATLSGGRSETLASATLDAFQVLHPGQTRLVIAGSAFADTTRELWLSIPGVPEDGDIVALDSAGIDDALAGRGATPFAMVRLVVPAVGGGTITEIWTSTGGSVTLDEHVVPGPLALCGASGGTFTFPARGTRLEPGGGRTDLGTATATGHYSTRVTVLSPADTLSDPARPPTRPPAIAFTAPNAGDADRCP